MSLAPLPEAGPLQSAGPPGRKTPGRSSGSHKASLSFTAASRREAPHSRSHLGPEPYPKLLHLGVEVGWQQGRRGGGGGRVLRTNTTAAAARSGKWRGPEPQKSALREDCPQGPPLRCAQPCRDPQQRVRDGHLPGPPEQEGPGWGARHWELGLSPSVSVLKSMESACSSAWRGRFQSARVRM